MKVIFLEDVPNVASAGDIKDVADGYGRNYLIPNKLAMAATPESIKLAQQQLQKKARVQAETEAEIARLAGELEGKEVVIAARAGSQERLYGSITAADIAAELEKSHGIIVDKRKIELTEPIRQLGSYEVEVKLAKDIVPKIKVTVQEQSTETTA